jgi:flagellar motor switch protein FliN/FliY
MADDQPPVSPADSNPSKEAEPAVSPASPGETSPNEIESAALNAASAESALPQASAPLPDTTDISDQAAMDELLKQASFEDVSPAGGGASPASEHGGISAAGGEGEGAGAQVAPDAAPFELPSFSQVMQDAQASSIELLRDVELNVKIELGRSRMLVEDVLKLAEGSVVELDKLAGDPVDVFVNDRLVARGEVLVLNDNFCVRVNEIVAGLKEEGL